ncbi:MAG: J domain-containing protein [Cyanobacteria bacterium J007]|nr:MAG: J domain-containing protein [Cyanobacteria bacterium J007]
MMAKQQKKQKKEIGDRDRPVAETNLASTSPDARFQFLQKRQKKVLTLIKRKRTELSNLTEQMQEIARSMLYHGQPIYEQAQQLDREIHELFHDIFTKRKFAKKTKLEIREVYEILQFTGRISPHFDEEDEDFAREEEAEAEREHPNEENDDSFDDKDGSEWGSHSLFEENHAPRPSRDMRKLFLKLADRFHPDKIADPEKREHYTEIMKEVNIAYKSGDFARLLEIEQQSEYEQKIETSQNDRDRQCKQLEHDLKILERQYEQLKDQVRETRNTPQGMMVKEYRKAKREGMDLVEASLEQFKAELESLEQIRDFVKDFRDRKITLKEFLCGPSRRQPLDLDNIEDVINELAKNGIHIHL